MTQIRELSDKDRRRLAGFLPIPEDFTVEETPEAFEGMENPPVFSLGPYTAEGMKERRAGAGKPLADVVLPLFRRGEGLRKWDRFFDHHGAEFTFTPENVDKLRGRDALLRWMDDICMSFTHGLTKEEREALGS